MKKYLLVLLVVGLIFGLGACARPTDIHECVNNTPGGFWWGLWNGICAPFSFIGSLFSNDISMYDINNNGGWYGFTDLPVSQSGGRFDCLPGYEYLEN